MSFSHLKNTYRQVPFSFLISWALFFSLQSYVLAEQQVKVGVYENPPKIFTDVNGTVTGFWPELLEHIAERENWKIVYVQGTWSEGLNRLKSHEIDIMPDVAYTKRREVQYAFSESPILLSWARFYVHKENNTLLSIEDLNGKRIAALKGSANLEEAEGLKDIIKKFNLRCTIVELDSYREVFKAIEEKTVDAGTTNRNFGNKNAKYFSVKKTSIIFYPIDIKFAFPNNSELTPYLQDKINEKISSLLTDDTSVYYELLKKYFETEIAEKRVEIIPQWLATMFKGVAGVGIILLLTTVVSRVQVRKKTTELQKEFKERLKAEEQFRLVFEYAPVSLWHEDFSEVQEYLNQLRQNGVKNFRDYFKMHPEAVKECVNLLNIIDVNRASLKLHHAKKKKELIDSLSDTFTEESFRVFEEGLIALANGEVSFQADAVVQTLDGRQKDVIMQMEVGSSTPRSMEGYVALTDITERKQAEEALGKSEKKLREAFDIINRSPSVAFLWKNAENWPVEFVTKNVTELFGYSVKEFISLKGGYVEVIHLDDIERVAEDVQFFSEEKGRTDFVHKPYRIITKNGDEKWIHDVTRIRRDQQGGITHYEGITYDITDRIQAEEAKAIIETQLHQAKKMEAIGLLAGGVAHDLNNILSGITGYPELLLMQLPEESEMRKPLEAIQNSGERAVAVVADLLTVARGVASAKSVASLNSLVNEFLDSPECDHLHSLHPELTCCKELADSLPNISCSPVHIKKCIMNLVTNSAEALEKSGTITINTSSIVPDLQWCQDNGVEQMEYVVLTVTDTGTGVPKESIEHIFEPFYSKKVLGRSGTGLGLAIVWNTLKEHHGTVTVTSSDQGTSFRLFFPVTEEAVTELESIKPETLQGNGETILVVDDEPHLRDIASSMLDAFGYNVVLTSSGEEAVAYLQDHRADLVLLDMLMDPGINGLQTYGRIIKLHPGQKALIASGFSESDIVKATLRLGASGFIKKPYSMDKLGRAVIKALGN